MVARHLFAQKEADGLGGDSELLDAARAHEAYVAGETLATTVGYDGETAGAATEIEGRDLRIALERAG